MTAWRSPAPPPSAGTAPPCDRRAGWGRLLIGAAGLGAAAAVLWWAGSAIPGPGAFDRHGLTRWLGDTDPVVVAFAVVRLAGLALAAWIAVTGAVATVVHATRLRRRSRLRRLVDQACFPVVRRLVHGATGTLLAAATLLPGPVGALTASTPPAPTASAARLPAAGEVAVMVSLPDDPGTSRPSLDPPAETAVLRSLDRQASTPSTAPPSTAPPSTAPTSTAPPGPRTPDEPAVPAPTEATGPAAVASRPLDVVDRTWTIAPGDHLWHVAEATLAVDAGVPVDVATVARYLDLLVAANRDRLVVPDDPDLVFAGQVLVLPETGPARR